MTELNKRLEQTILMENKNAQQPGFDLLPETRIHLVGIGGAGLSAIAKVLIDRGYQVSGSDEQSNAFTAELALAGVDISHGHKADNVEGVDVLLVSSAIPADNPELKAAEQQQIPVLKRGEFLGALLRDDFGIAIAGSHGKTTTTGMVAQILIKAGTDPSVIVGGVLPILGGNGRSGKSDYFLIEADEYDGMFLGLEPDVAVITNVEYDHPDQFPSVEAYQSMFKSFVQRLRPAGKLIVCADNSVGLRIGRDYLDHFGATNEIAFETFGLGTADWQAHSLRQNQLGGTDFVVDHNQRLVGLARLRVPGDHNVLNALAAIAVASGLGVSFNVIRQALAEFSGMGRRFQFVGEEGGVIVVDDYAHHPTEIKVTLAAARQRFTGKRIWAVWQPHTFSRTKRMMEDFAQAFGEADKVVVMDIFRSRESDSLGLSGASVADVINHHDVRYVGGNRQVVSFILDRIRPDDVILTLTAGDGNQVGQQILDELGSRLIKSSPNYSSR